MLTALDHLRQICLALPDVHEVPSHGEPTFRVRNKQFAVFANAANHHGNGRNAAWVKSTHLMQSALVHAQPDRFFVPPYVAHLGWVGVYLDDDSDWARIADLVEEAHRMVVTLGMSSRTATRNSKKI